MKDRMSLLKNDGKRDPPKDCAVGTRFLVPFFVGGEVNENVEEKRVTGGRRGAASMGVEKVRKTQQDAPRRQNQFYDAPRDLRVTKGAFVLPSDRLLPPDFFLVSADDIITSVAPIPGTTVTKKIKEDSFAGPSFGQPPPAAGNLPLPAYVAKEGGRDLLNLLGAEL